ncbi:ATP-binding cassette domain-containing protein [Streptomyces albipurpureus]|uniref:ATP-binding cassette domain-containing protein n=1 Tax=Streptomyces albipurpureus TaxID=2897419 RepID=A0ABT0UIX1_9ACTN|nr:ATP-binding cassette domain-containing protein [Streptomyces sp. CWNU-1]MCM2388394.1 ATP-binding cassette domain-containing protein [Streptomyces sp. CWNU-1]
MLQAIGLTSCPRRDLPPIVQDLSFEARAGQITALLGPVGSGKSTTLRLMLELEPGRGVTYFRGNPLHRIVHPTREVGALLGDVPGHPARTVRGQLRMLSAAAGVPLARADHLLEAVGLTGLRSQRLDSLPLAADRRLGVAVAMLGGPQTLLLDEPNKGLAAGDRLWMHRLMRAHAASGGTVLYTVSDPKEAARIADRIVTLDAGRLVADQEVAAFSRTRLRPRVAVRTPHAARLASLIHRESRAARRSVEVVVEGGSALSVYGSSCAELGEIAYRYRLPVHRLADEVGVGAWAREPGQDAPPQPARRPHLPPDRSPSAPDTGAEPGQVIEADNPAVPDRSPESARGHEQCPGPEARPARLPPAEAHPTPHPTSDAEEPTPVPAEPADSSKAPTAPGSALALPAEPAGSQGVPAAPRPIPCELAGAPEEISSTSAGAHPARRTPVEPLDRPTPGIEARHPPTAAPHAQCPAIKPTNSRSLPGEDTADAPPLGAPRPVPRPQAPAHTHRAPSRESRPRALAGPLRPVRYELLRLLGIRTTAFILAGALLLSLALCLLLARSSAITAPVAIAAWPEFLPLPPAALSAGLIGALSFGEESRYPALAAACGTVPRRFGLLLAKLLVTGVAAVSIALLVAVADAQALRLVYGSAAIALPGNPATLLTHWCALSLGCAWAGLLAAGVFRVTAAGVAAVLSVPVVVAPLVQQALIVPSVRSVAGLPRRVRELTWVWLPQQTEVWLLAGVRMLAQPVGMAMVLSLSVLICAYLFTDLRRSARW